jgi:hypothetical protein
VHGAVDVRWLFLSLCLKFSKEVMGSGLLLVQYKKTEPETELQEIFS